MFEWITGIVQRLGYVGVALLTLAENVFPPIPSELVIPLAGFIAAQGDLTFWGVVVAGSVGSVAGAVLWYEIGRRVGERRVRRWVGRFGKWLTLGDEDVDRAQQWFRRRGAPAVLVGRLVPGVRTFVSLPAGFAGMPFGAFVAYSAVGTVIWTAALAYAGVMLRANYQRVGDYLDVLTTGLLVLGGVLLVRRYVKCWRAAGKG